VNANAFHEKGGWSQVGSCALGGDKVFLGPVSGGEVMIPRRIDLKFVTSNHHRNVCPCRL